MSALQKKDEYIKSLSPLLDTFECSICRDGFRNEHTPVRLECGHVFGTQCVIEWFESSKSANTCPVCRRELFQADRDDEDDSDEEEEVEEEREIEENEFFRMFDPSSWNGMEPEDAYYGMFDLSLLDHRSRILRYRREGNAAGEDVRMKNEGASDEDDSDESDEDYVPGEGDDGESEFSEGETDYGEGEMDSTE